VCVHAAQHTATLGVPQSTPLHAPHGGASAAGSLGAAAAAALAGFLGAMTAS
jgi:hypothetical protein